MIIIYQPFRDINAGFFVQPFRDINSTLMTYSPLDPETQHHHYCEGEGDGKTVIGAIPPNRANTDIIGDTAKSSGAGRVPVLTQPRATSTSDQPFAHLSSHCLGSPP